MSAPRQTEQEFIDEMEGIFEGSPTDLENMCRQMRGQITSRRQRLARGKYPDPNDIRQVEIEIKGLEKLLQKYEKQANELVTKLEDQILLSLGQSAYTAKAKIVKIKEMIETRRAEISLGYHRRLKLRNEIAALKRLLDKYEMQASGAPAPAAAASGGAAPGPKATVQVYLHPRFSKLKSRGRSEVIDYRTFVECLKSLREKEDTGRRWLNYAIEKWRHGVVQKEMKTDDEVEIVVGKHALVTWSMADCIKYGLDSYLKPFSGNSVIEIYIRPKDSNFRSVKYYDDKMDELKSAAAASSGGAAPAAAASSGGAAPADGAAAAAANLVSEFERKYGKSSDRIQRAKDYIRHYMGDRYKDNPHRLVTIEAFRRLLSKYYVQSSGAAPPAAAAASNPAPATGAAAEFPDVDDTLKRTWAEINKTTLEIGQKKTNTYAKHVEEKLAKYPPFGVNARKHELLLSGLRLILHDLEKLLEIQQNIGAMSNNTAQQTIHTIVRNKQNPQAKTDLKTAEGTKRLYVECAKMLLSRRLPPVGGAAPADGAAPNAGGAASDDAERLVAQFDREFGTSESRIERLKDLISHYVNSMAVIDHRSAKIKALKQLLTKYYAQSSGAAPSAAASAFAESFATHQMDKIWKAMAPEPLKDAIKGVAHAMNKLRYCQHSRGTLEFEKQKALYNKLVEAKQKLTVLQDRVEEVRKHVSQYPAKAREHLNWRINVFLPSSAFSQLEADYLIREYRSMLQEIPPPPPAPPPPGDDDEVEFVKEDKLTFEERIKRNEREAWADGRGEYVSSSDEEMLRNATDGAPKPPPTGGGAAPKPPPAVVVVESSEDEDEARKKQRTEAAFVDECAAELGDLSI